MYRFFIFYCIFISCIEMYKINNTKKIFSGYDMRPIATESIKTEKQTLLNIKKNIIKKDILKSLESKYIPLNDKLEIIKNSELFPVDYVGDINAAGLFKDFDFDFEMNTIPK